MTAFEHSATGKDVQFSPLTRLLLAIEARLLSKEVLTVKDVQEELIDGINSLSIPMVAESGASLLLEFPLVTCWLGADCDDLVTSFYKLERTRGAGTKPQHDALTPRELAESLQGDIRRLHKAGAIAGGFGSLPSNAINAHDIKRYKDLESFWYFRYTEFEHGGTERLLHILAFPKVYPRNAQAVAPLGELRNAFERDFIQPGCSQFSKLLSSFPSATSTDRGPSEASASPLILDPEIPDLQSILSGIHRSCTRLEMLFDGSDAGIRHDDVGEFPKLRDAFVLLFCRPVLFQDGEPRRGFKYQFTTIQHEALRSFAESASFLEQLRSEIHRCCWRELRQMIVLIKTGFSSLPRRAKGISTTEYVKLLINWANDTAPLASFDAERRRDGFLRRAAMWLYAYQPDSRNRLEKTFATIGRAIENVTIPSEQAELIDILLAYGDAEMVEEPFITHRLSTLDTATILAATRHLWAAEVQPVAIHTSSLYDSFVHLAERLLFPPRFYMYPLFWQRVPVVVCGMDADRISAGRGKVVELLWDNAGALLLSILHQELREIIGNLSSALEARAKGKTKDISIDDVLRDFSNARRQLSYHVLSVLEDSDSSALEVGGVHADLYRDLEGNARTFFGMADASARRGAAWRFLRWLRHEVAEWVVEMDSCRRLLQASGAPEPPIAKLEAILETVRMTVEVPIHSIGRVDIAPISLVQFKEHLETLFRSFDSVEWKLDTHDLSTETTLEHGLLLIAVELVRNAKKRHATVIVVDLEGRGHGIVMVVRGTPQPRSGMVDLESANCESTSVEDDLSVELRGQLGLKMVKEIAASLGGDITWRWSVIDAEYMHVAAICRVPVVADKER